MERYKNKWFRLTLEKDLKNEALGVNVHCKEDGIHLTVPPHSPTGDQFTDDYAKEILREDHDTQRIVDKVKKFVKDYEINVDMEKAIYGDNIKIKLKVENERNN
jgi:hypothetical protein|tara:strand:+ start:2734 stop:3045 length:312 start_codon:yes stop_codon:yes gene_type:complete